MSFEKLFSPIKIRELELRNRVVMSAMGTHEQLLRNQGYYWETYALQNDIEDDAAPAAALQGGAC